VFCFKKKCEERMADAHSVQVPDFND
jgi:hypothetical protein